MATIDMTHRKLHFPPRFLPYLEKHRIFELFHECVELLLQVKPKDHIQFLKNVLPCAAMKKDKQRVVFITPASFDRGTFSKLLSDCLGIQCMNKNLLAMMTEERKQSEKIQIDLISESVEEESCICPGEGELPQQLYYPIIPGEGIYEEHEINRIDIIEGIEEEEEKEPCICVCPCVEEDFQAERNLTEEDEKKKEEEEEEEGEEEEIKRDKGSPCVPLKQKRICERKPPDTLLPYGSPYYAQDFDPLYPESSLFLDINYGILAECEVSAKGWILEDFPKTWEEAESLNTLGVIPTHAIRIILNEEAEENDQEYKANVQRWMKAYKYVPVKVIRIRGRDIAQLVQDMCNLLSVMPHRHAPMIPRMVLIGSRGAGVTTQAQKLAKKYGIVHVEYELVMNRALQQDDELCKLYKIQLATRPDPELEAVILERALLTSMCRNRGWVLTGYPRNIDQMRMLDIVATPPNRVIFVEVPPRECFVRLYYRKIDSCLGDEYKLPQTEPSGLDSCETPGLEPEVASRLLSHPRNDKKQIVHDIEDYFLKKQDMMAYCGRTASYVDGNQEVDRVFELIEQILMNPAPAQPPRDPLALNYGIEESYERLKKFRLKPGMYFNNMLLNPPERVQALNVLQKI